MKHSTVFLGFVIVLALACNLGAAATPAPTTQSPVSDLQSPPPAASPAPPSTEVSPQPTSTPVSQRRCGDLVCDGPENNGNCPGDCPISNPTPQSPVSGDQSSVAPGPAENTYWVTNPTSGAKLYVEVLHPSGWSNGALPAFVLVPGGNGGAQDMLRPNRSAQTLADAGFTVIIFDADGRGQSEGTEDQNGFVQQDGLAAIVRWAATLPEVDANRIGLGSFSYGGTMASGALARYPDLPVRFFVDWEGPADRTDTGGCDASRTGHLRGKVACDDETFWSQREEVTFIAQIKVPYQRIQTEKDHAQPDGLHSLKVVNAAVAGGVPWVRLNDDAPNQTYDLNAPPTYLPESADRQLMELFARYAGELLGGGT